MQNSSKQRERPNKPTIVTNDVVEGDNEPSSIIAKFIQESSKSNKAHRAKIHSKTTYENVGIGYEQCVTAENEEKGESFKHKKGQLSTIRVHKFRRDKNACKTVLSSASPVMGNYKFFNSIKQKNKENAPAVKKFQRNLFTKQSENHDVDSKMRESNASSDREFGVVNKFNSNISSNNSKYNPIYNSEIRLQNEANERISMSSFRANEISERNLGKLKNMPKKSSTVPSKFKLVFDHELASKMSPRDGLESAEVTDSATIDDTQDKMTPKDYVFNISLPNKGMSKYRPNMGRNQSATNLLGVKRSNTLRIVNAKTHALKSPKNGNRSPTGIPRTDLDQSPTRIDYASMTKQDLISQNMQLRIQRDMYYKMYQDAMKLAHNTHNS